MRVVNLNQPQTEIQSSVSSDSITVREQVSECFKPRYRPRSVKIKGAILVIVWGFLNTSLYSNLYYFVSSTYSKPVSTALIIAFSLTIPCAGWLADVRFGRYKIISSSIWIMWISALLLTTGQLVLQSVSVSNTVYFYKYLINPINNRFCCLSSKYCSIWSGPIIRCFF